MCPATHQNPAMGNLSGRFLVLGLDVLPPAIFVVKADNPVEDALPWSDPGWMTPELSLPLLATSKAIIPLKTMASFGTKKEVTYEM
ncbi:hypothetical protein H8959_016611 [Pygathrix nigripes]